METQFHYDITGSKQLSFKLRERITTKPGLELKVKGLFNTVTGNLDYVGSIKKYMSFGSEVSKGATAAKDNGSSPTRLGLGLLTSSADKMAEPLLTFSADKKYALLDGPNTLLTARAHVNVNPQEPKEVCGYAAVSLASVGFCQQFRCT